MRLALVSRYFNKFEHFKKNVLFEIQPNLGNNRHVKTEFFCVNYVWILPAQSIFISKALYWLGRKNH